MSRKSNDNTTGAVIGRRTLLSGAAALGAGFAFAPSIRRASAAETFKLGWVRPTTGRLVTSFAPLYAGGLIAVDEINAAGGIMGRQIERIEVDDEASPAKQPAVIKKLEEEGCRYVLGPTGSSQSLSALAVTTPAKMIHGYFAVSTALGDGRKYPYGYQTTFNTEHQAQAAVEYLVKTLKAKKIGILQENTAFGEQAVADSKTHLQKHGLTPVVIEVFPPTAPDLNAYLANLERAGIDGLMIWAAAIPQLSMAFNGLASMNWFPPTVGHNQLFNESLLPLVPAESIKNVYGTALKNFTWNDSVYPDERQVNFAKKVQAFPGAKGSEPIIACSPFYDFLHVLKHAVEKAKSFDVDAVKAALDGVKGFPGMAGTINFSPENHCALAAGDLCMARVDSARDPKSLGMFRQRAPGL